MPSDIVRQMDFIFRARSIAVIGASNTPGSWGYRMMDNPRRAGFQGPIYPVNPNQSEVLGSKAYPTVRDIPHPVDLAVIAVPAPAVPQVMSQCVEKGVGGAVLISAGFAEVGEAGRALQEQVTAIARRGGLRFVGPNGAGIHSSAAKVCLAFEEAPRPGPIGFISQSGAFGGYLAGVAQARGYGLSTFISIGNQADLNAADYVEYLAQDPDTRTLVLYMEGFPQGRRFFQVARETVPHKPIIIFKGGRTAVGARAAQSHTGSLAGEDRVFDAMCRQAGIIRASEVMHAFDMAQALVSQPLPRGNRVAIMGSGGQGVATSDTCLLCGLEVPEFDTETAQRLRQYLPRHAPLPRNPLDFAGGDRGPLDEVAMAQRLLELDCVDGLITYLPGDSRIHGESQPATQAAELLASLPGKFGKPVIALKRGAGLEVQALARKVGIPSYDTPEECVRAMYALARYAQARRELGGPPAP